MRQLPTTDKETFEMSKKLAKVVWDKALDSIPEDYTFEMSTGQDTFPKGS